MKTLLQKRIKIDAEFKQYGTQLSKDGLRDWIPEASSVIRRLRVVDRAIEQERQMLARILYMAIDEVATTADSGENGRASRLARIVSEVPVKMYNGEGVDLTDLKHELNSYELEYAQSSYPPRPYAKEMESITRFDQDQNDEELSN